MKWILAILLLISATTFGQIGRGDDSTKYIRYQNQYGQRMPRSWWDSVAHMPYGDTALFPKPCRPGAIMMHTDKVFYKWDGAGWASMGSGGGSADSTTFATNYRVDSAKANLRTEIAGKQPTGNYITALTGPVTASGPGSAATSITNNAITNAMIRQSAGSTLVGNPTGSTANVQDITKGYGLTFSGTTLLADTSSSNHLVTQSDLNDTAAVLRAAIGSGGSTLQSVTTAGATTTNKIEYVNIPYLLQADSNKLTTRKYVDSRQESYLGTIYNKNTWASLSDFTQTGGITAAASGGKISLSAGAGTFTQTLDLNWFTMLERWKMAARFKITSAPGGATYGIGFGVHSTNAYGAVNALGRIDLTSGGSGGQLFLNGHTSNAQLAASATNLPIANNDTILLTVERKVDSLIVYATNISQGGVKVRIGYKYDITTSMTAQLPNTGRFSIFSFGGTQAIDSISITSNELKNSTLLVMGDSKTQAYYADLFSSRFASQLDLIYLSTVIHAGGYDRTTEWLTYLPEIKLLAPKQVLLTNPSNDARSGISSGTSQAQYQQVVDSLTSWGIEVYHALAFYESAQDNSGWNTYITTTYPADHIIDTWNPTKNCTGCIAGDGIHLTKKGNDTVYTAIKDSYKIKFGGTNRSSGGLAGSSGTDNTLPMFLAGSLVNSFVYQDADRVYMSKGFESSSTDPGFDLYKTDAATDEKGWNVYSDATSMYFAAFNDARNAVSNAIKINRTGTSINYTAITNGNLVVGATSDPGSYPMSVITSGAGLSRFRTSNSTGGYIGLENGTTTRGYIGYGSVLTTGAGNNDVTLRSQDDTIHLSDNSGSSMFKVAAGKIYVTSHAIGSNSDSAVIWDRSTNEYKIAKINGVGISDQTHTSGTSVTISNGVTRLFVDPSSALASLDITFPSSPTDGQEVRIFFGGATINSAASDVVTGGISSWNASGSGFVPNLPASATPIKAGTVYIFQYKASNTYWYQIK